MIQVTLPFFFDQDASLQPKHKKKTSKLFLNSNQDYSNSNFKRVIIKMQREKTQIRNKEKTNQKIKTFDSRKNINQ
jgi:hypothetical protein